MGSKERGGLIIEPHTLGMMNIDGKADSISAIRFSLMSDEKILRLSHGRVSKPDTISAKTLKPQIDGLHSERIFGTRNNMSCVCIDKDYLAITKILRSPKYRGVCPDCGVRITPNLVRRENFGHIELPVYVVNGLFYLYDDKWLPAILEMKVSKIRDVAYYKKYVVLEPGPSVYQYKDVISPEEAQKLYLEYGDAFRAGTGGACIRELLEDTDLVAIKRALVGKIDELKAENAYGKLNEYTKRLELINKFLKSGNRLEDFVHAYVLVTPPDTRPIRVMSGTICCSDTDQFYQLIINRCIRMEAYKELCGGKLDIYDVQYRLIASGIQKAVDCLYANEKFTSKTLHQYGGSVYDHSKRMLVSQTDRLEGKKGRFRQNLLGKRVDYSGRSVIVVGPKLKMSQCGLPKEMAMELYKPHVISKLTENSDVVPNLKVAMKLYAERNKEELVWDALNEVIKDSRVLLNRAPTLHRLGIQAFEPVLVEGKAIQLPPLACTAFNADFDGDQMAVHLPLSREAQAESVSLMGAEKNILKPADGSPVSVPSQDMVLGIYYLTQERMDAKGKGMCFASVNEAYLAYENGAVTLHAPIKVRIVRTKEDGTKVSGVYQTTLGRCLFNEVIPQDLGIIDRTNPSEEAALEVNFLVGKKQLKKIISACIDKGKDVSAILDSIKELGYKYSTRSGITFSMADIEVPEEKNELIDKATKQIGAIQKNFRRGIITEEERYREVISTWRETDDIITETLLSGMEKTNPVYMMADSGARGSDKQIKQLAGMRGLMANAAGKTIELPITSNFREGLDVLEYFISAHGARKGLTDTALRTADAGYLTRRLVDVAQSVICCEKDCAQDIEDLPGMYVSALMDGSSVIESLEERIAGRVACEDIFDDDVSLIVAKNQLISQSNAKRICATKRVKESGKVKIRTVFSCRCMTGVCSKCYGADLSTWELMEEGKAVGVIAAQSIGEPGTQLTMRTFHTGGVAGDDITQGLPRVEQIFENRKPKKCAIVALNSGTVELSSKKNRRIISVCGDELIKSYNVPYDYRIIVKDGEYVEKGTCLTDGVPWTTDILETKGVLAAQEFLLSQIQTVYRQQAVDLSDKHIEIISRRMFDLCRIVDNGDTELEIGCITTRRKMEGVNAEVIEKGLVPASVKCLCLGVAKVALYAEDSPISAASFQQATHSIMNAAASGNTDYLRGLKENVIIGKMIPAGTGYRK